MIGRLRGKIIEQQADGRCLLDVHGVGYELWLAAPTAGVLSAEQEHTLFIHTHVREDVLQLYAFQTAVDKEAFRLLLSVASIGPKLAAAIVSHLGAAGLQAAVVRGDKTAFRGISGVGKKTVERLLIDLKDRLAALQIGPGPAPVSAAGAAAPALPDDPLHAVFSALVAMGYRAQEAQQAVESIRPEAEGQNSATLVRLALGQLR
ncbi:MAG: Holliday junction branch migration protein RuvA [Polyangiales bacterium]